MNNLRGFVQRLLAAALTALVLAAGGALPANAADVREAEKLVAKGTRDFAIDMYLELAKGAGNVVFSPQNIAGSLAMAYAGASEPVAREMEKVLRFGPGTHEGMGALAKQFAEGKVEDCEVRTANALWPAKDAALAPDFEKIVKMHYAGEVRQLDYAKNPETARGTINRWVADRTNDRIKDLIPGGGVNKGTPMVLTSAIYFLGRWQRPFDKDATRDAPFYAEKKTNVKMMCKRELVAYLEREGTQMIRMRYWDDRYSMVVALPPKDLPFAKFEASLKNGRVMGQLQDILAPKAKVEDVQIHMPRFRSEASYALKAKFEDLGLRKAFEGNAFGGMLAPTKDKKLIPLYIDEIYHKAFIDVNEKSTEAAAATAMTMVRGTAMPSEPVAFRADRPFIYFLVENETGAILFMGRYVRP